MQFHNDDESKILSSRWMKPSLHEKSNSFKFFSKLPKTSKPEETLKALNALCNGEFTPQKLIGVPVTGYIVQTSFTNKTDGSNVEINDIETVTPGKKSIETRDFIMPKWSIDCMPVEQIWDDKAQTPGSDTPTAPSKAEVEKVFDQSSSTDDSFFESIGAE